MDKNQDLIKRIQSGMEDFSKGQKLIANFIINHYDKAAYMTAARLGEEVGVSESTVVRFANEIGYDGYPKLQSVLREMNKSKLTAVQRIEVTSNRINEGNILKSVLQSDMEKIKATLEDIDQESFNNIVQSILNAKRIYILGVRSSAPLASFLGFYFNLIFDNVRLVHTTSVSEMFEQIIHASREDVVIGISFPRYSKRTINAMRFAQHQGATVVAITDSLNSPLAQNSDHVITARSDMASFVDSLVAPLSVINALIVAIGMSRKPHVHDTFERLEKIWDEYKVYEKHDHESDYGEED
ncbi:MurR/RpiR family transcriptional regulator [Acetivibrio mesophilus]|uniref:MurR/RpiR family transcriptional regulator n=1 Tax=Acetivibrio mesophilus TaxID=2487273 RepID=A0A4Q0I2F2_9FIRM|nr:MurR/RpiR family transcriptional regulator [Acetivibrio mesophilus]ODM25450.1 N-acetylmannosamine kinase [Clostridium sp. Bc-iso-3]RXE58321.1 MurR/RpiR family transcriptional regulator [Acetivibrio mesophilus]HHV28878.1 MurR/RpiR family transcriptional regulator [Clostridium sp.]